MSHDLAFPSFRLGPIPVSAIDNDDLVAAVTERLDDGSALPGTFVIFRDAHGVVRADDDPAIRQAHEDAFLVCPDGRPLVWIGRLRGFRAMGQVSGIEAVTLLCRAGIAPGWRHYFIGGGPGVAQDLAAAMAAKVPGLLVAGAETPPFRDLSRQEEEAMRVRIRGSGARIVWVGLSTPKQETWMARHAHDLPGVICMGVGAAFDVNAGRIARAPWLLRVSGLEWFYRMLREPRRLGRRYLLVIPRFVAIVLADALGRRRPSTRPVARPAARPVEKSSPGA